MQYPDYAAQKGRQFFITGRGFILIFSVMRYISFKSKNRLKWAFGLLFDKLYGKRAGSGSTAHYKLHSGVFFTVALYRVLLFMGIAPNGEMTKCYQL
jgi:hypothetical protein